MCGIVGILGTSAVAERLVEGLKRLEYRGYDSAGVATLDDGKLDRRRASGKLRNLEAVLEERPLGGKSGIGHTRWATHGGPSEVNAHPHMTGKVCLVHNGIIENFRELKTELAADGFTMESDTDTEVVAHLITREMNAGADPVLAVVNSLKRLSGAFALAILFKDFDDLMIAARQGSPLAIGFGDGEVYLGSDAIALAPFTDAITYLEDGDWAVLTREGVAIRDRTGNAVERPVVRSAASALLVDKGNHRHFMAKEIHEQPDVVGHTLAHYIEFATNTVQLPDNDIDFSKLNRLTISACGTAFYAGLIAKYWFEQVAGLPVEIDIASEMRYRSAPVDPNGMALFVSQSGETADTLATLQHFKAAGLKTAAVVNVMESSMARDCDTAFPTLAGPEIGVASTKAFTCQLATLACLAIAAGRQRGWIDEAREQELVSALLEVPRLMAAVLESEETLEQLAQPLSKARDVLYLGRGTSYPLAMEGALKLKEISYIHAEGYAAGELKHGPIALIDEAVPVIVIAPHDGLFEKTVSNMQEVQARGGRILLITQQSDLERLDGGLATVGVPACDPFVAPLVYAIPIQLLAYYTAVSMGTDVDQPRNLAKSVTVE